MYYEGEQKEEAVTIFILFKATTITDCDLNGCPRNGWKENKLDSK